MSAEQSAVRALTIDQVDAITDDDMTYWLGNPFMTPEMLAEKVCYWVTKAVDSVLAAVEQEIKAGDSLGLGDTWALGVVREVRARGGAS